MDIVHMVSRLRPGADWGWRGEYNGPDIENYDLLDWRDHMQSKPTQQEIDAEWQVYLREQNEQNVIIAAVKNAAQSAVGVEFSALTNVQTRALLVILLWRAQAINRNGTVSPLEEWVLR